jgi:hypothetical protein
MMTRALYDTTTTTSRNSQRNSQLRIVILVLATASSLALAACKPETPVVAPAASESPAADSAPAAQGTPATATPVVSGPVSAEALALIGRTVPPYPDGLGELQGGCVPGGDTIERACDFGLAVIGDNVGEDSATARYLIASRNTDSAAETPTWQISDAVDAPALAAGFELQLLGCRINGEDDSGLVAAVRYGEDEYSSDITWARRYDTASGKLADVPLDQVDCGNPGYGV